MEKASFHYKFFGAEKDFYCRKNSRTRKKWKYDKFNILYKVPFLCYRLSEKGKEAKGIRRILLSKIKRSTPSGQPQPGAEDDIVSNNAKIVLYGLFALIGFAILMYTITITKQISADDIDQVNMVYIAAISGTLALGGTLIAQLWGRD